MGVIKIILLLVSLFSMSLGVSAVLLIRGIMDDDAIEVGDPEAELDGQNVTEITIPIKVPNEGIYPVSPDITVKIYKHNSDELLGEGTKEFTIGGRSDKEIDMVLSIEEDFQSEMATYDGQLDVKIEIGGTYAWFIPIPAQDVEKTVDYSGPL